MSQYLAISEKKLKENNAYWTAREISQQPGIWLKVARDLKVSSAEVEGWLKPILRTEKLRIILTGAGTSAYVGESLTPHLSKVLGQTVEAISTTNIVGNPDQYLYKKVPTLIISYARSGDSPESLAVCALGDQVIDECYHLAITCNKASALSSYLESNSKARVQLMPAETLDNSFAMTSSFSAMLLATLCIFTPNETMLKKAIDQASVIIDEKLNMIKEQADLPYNRAVFLGAGGLLGIATEAKLKMLELSGGEIDCYSESPLGFRHGPKLIVNEKTLVILLGSSDQHTQKYDNDLYNELRIDAKTPFLFNLTDQIGGGIDDVWSSLPYIVYCQILAFYKSLALGYTPDNPCPTGEANRVVQGVKIYPYKG